MNRKDKIALLNNLSKGEISLNSLKANHYEMTYGQDGNVVSTVNGVVIKEDDFGPGFINSLFLDLHYGRSYSFNINQWTGKKN